MYGSDPQSYLEESTEKDEAGANVSTTEASEWLVGNSWISDDGTRISSPLLVTYWYTIRLALKGHNHVRAKKKAFDLFIS